MSELYRNKLTEEDVNEMSFLAWKISGGTRLLSVGPLVSIFARNPMLREAWMSRHFTPSPPVADRRSAPAA